MKKHDLIAILSLILGCLSVNACREAPRYALHDGTDPESGTRSTIRLDTSTGKAEILKSVSPEPGYSVAYWKETHSESTAMEVIKAYARANADRINNAEMLRTNPGAPLIIK
jgi:hypothetical protein